ncbi:MAG: PAS domain-containing protein, partial [Chthoniobacterales bacterium]|nr:PAS domain-containing protein [Chthoniobacterales bacterium]
MSKVANRPTALLSRWKTALDLRVGIITFAVAVIAINALVLMGHARKEKHVVLQSVALDNVRVATAFEQYASRTIGLADTVIRFLAREFGRSGASIDLAQMFADGTIDPELFGAATIIAPDGTAIASSDGRLDAARFAILRHHGFAALPEAGSGLQVGQPIPAAAGRGQMIPFVRRLDLPGGGFAGIVVLEMAPAHFIDFDVKAAPQSDEVIALIGFDRIVRARRAGQLFTSGENVAEAVQFQPGAGLTGDFVATSPIDGIRRLFHVRQVRGYPLIVVAGVEEADALAEVSARVNASYTRALVLTGIILLLAISAIGALTRGKRAFAQLRASEAMLRAHEGELRTLTESMPQLVWIADAEGSHSYFNQQWIDYTGLSLAQSIGDGWKAAFEPAEQAQALQRWHEAVAKGEVYETEYRLRRADGVYRWMLARALPLRDASGRITKWFGTSTDVENQVVARAELREAQQVAHVGSWSRDPHTGALTWSDELYHIFGVTPAEFVPSYDSIREFIHLDDRAQYRRDHALSIATMESFQRDVRIVRRDGQVRSLQHSVAVELDDSGAGSRVHGTIQDVTEAREAERQLREQANLLNLTDDAVVVRDLDDTIRFWNHGAEEVYGWTSAEVIGKRASDFAYVDRSKFAAAKRVLAERGEWSGELDHFCKDGHTVTMGSRWKAVPNDGHTGGSVLVINTDLTEQKKHEAHQLRTQRLESIGTLASGVAHDLNNILAPILMAAPLLRDEIPAEKRDQLVSLLEQSAERGAAIVRQVLTFARGADGERVLVQPIYALKEIAQIASETFPKSITVQTSYPEDLALIEADPTELH